MRHACLLAVCVAAAWPSFWMPFRGDEAIYLVIARQADAGQVLYRDQWEVTNPGILWFYQVAGTLFGFSEDGVRLLDAVWQTAFAFTVSLAAKRSGRLPRLPVLPGAIVVLVYMLAGYSNTSHLARVEGLLPFPMFLAFWCPTAAMTAGRRAWPWLIAGGLAGGLVPVFKLAFGPVVVVVWLYLAVEFARRRGGSMRRNLGLFTGCVGFGAILPLAATGAYFAAHDAFGIFRWTMLEAPRLMLREAEPAGIHRLAIALQWFAAHLAGPAAFAWLAVACSLRRGRDPLVVGLVTAMILCVPVILIQRLSWWSYHGMLPAGLLAALAGYGLPAIAQTLRERRIGGGTRREAIALVGFVVILSMPLVGAGAHQWLIGAKHRFGVTKADRAAARAEQGQAYRFAQTEADWLNRPESRPGAIFVAGDPLILVLSGRTPAVGVAGWSLEVWPEPIRRRLADEIRERRPVYVYIGRRDDDYEALLPIKYPDVQALLNDRYTQVKRDARSTWYEAK